MTELLIDGQEVVLPSDFNTTIKKENCFITKNGEYTYEITLSLNNKGNALLYSFLNRCNSANDISVKRRAILKVDNRILCDGTEIITGWNDNEVNIQIAAGNSEFNFAIKDDLLISSLELGNITEEFKNGERFIEGSIYSSYPDYNFVYCPVFNRTSNCVINNWRTSTKGYLTLGDSARIPQPYFCAILKKIIKAIGYEINSNDLDGSRYSKLIILNNTATKEYAKMLPGWNVKDFIEMAEQLLNIVLIVDSKKKTVDIVFSNNYYKGAKEINLKSVVDEYEVSYNTDNETDITNANLSYGISEDGYNRDQIDDSIIEISTIIEKESYSDIECYLNDNKPAREILRDKSNGREYIYSNSLNLIVEINRFKDLDRKASNKIEMKSLPASLYYFDIKCTDRDNNDTYKWVMPGFSGSETIDDSNEKSLSDIIENNETVHKEADSKNNIYFSFYDGLKKVNESILYPTAFSDNIVQLDSFKKLAEDELSLRLYELDKLLYTTYYTIDTEKEYLFNVFDDNIPDARGIFVINNKRFICKEMTFEVNSSEKVKEWKIYAYPINISDTEALNRWILSDGKWRDGGVWLDNGRWLDK